MSIREPYETLPDTRNFPDYPLPTQPLPPIILPTMPLPPPDDGQNNYPVITGGDVPLPTSTTHMQCNCLIGTPYIDNNGNCACTSYEIPTHQTGGVKPIPVIDSKSNTPVIYYTNMPNAQARSNSLIQQIKDNPHLALIGAAVLAYLIFKK